VKRALLFAFALGCGPASTIAPSPSTPLREVARSAEDTTTKQDLRLVPPEVYIRSYLQLFGGLAPQEVQARARGTDGAQLFDAWDDYLAALGLPDYKLDLPRASQTNAIMVAAFERLAVALCDRAVERDLKSKPPLPVGERVVFAFEAPEALDDAGFATRFDLLHRTFLGYPAKLAPSREKDFHTLYASIVSHHAGAKSRFSPTEAGWAAVCYGLARHPEFHLY
jgi:hypothetical protein